MLTDFKKMSPQEMIDYYAQKITELSPPSGPSDSLLIEVLRNLIEYNKKQVANEPFDRNRLISSPSAASESVNAGNRRK